MFCLGYDPELTLFLSEDGKTALTPRDTKALTYMGIVSATLLGVLIAFTGL